MEPLSEKRYLELHAPAGGDFLAARERLLAALPDGCRLTLGCLQQLYPVLSAADYRVTVTLCPGPGGTDAVRVEPGDTTAEHYGLCLDIGSTIDADGAGGSACAAGRFRRQPAPTARRSSARTSSTASSR